MICHDFSRPRQTQVIKIAFRRTLPVVGRTLLGVAALVAIYLAFEVVVVGERLPAELASELFPLLFVIPAYVVAGFLVEVVREALARRATS